MNKQDLEHLSASGCSICRGIAERESKTTEVADALVKGVSHGFDAGYLACIDLMSGWVDKHSRQTYARGYGEQTFDSLEWKAFLVESKKLVTG